MQEIRADVDIGVGRDGLRTFKPAVVRGDPHLVSVSQDAIPNLNPALYISPKHRELMVSTHPIAWKTERVKRSANAALEAK